MRSEAQVAVVESQWGSGTRRRCWPVVGRTYRAVEGVGQKGQFPQHTATETITAAERGWS